MVIYRDGEVVEAVLMCSFFVGTVVYGVRNQDSWGNVERSQFLVWAVISGVTCSLVAILGQRVHAVSEYVDFWSSPSSERRDWALSVSYHIIA